MRYTATYSPEDNKLRLYASERLDAETYARVKAAGYSWAPRQELFVAPMWTPERADLLLELAGEIGDEDTSLAERAEQRADRFDDYSDKRLRDAERAREGVARIADGIPLGQPILIGHHSERHARRDAERIDSGMRRAVKMWETSEYWERRAKGALQHAKYKERTDVRLRRIKGLEAEARKLERSKAAMVARQKWWARDTITPEDVTKWANTVFGDITCDDGQRRGLYYAWKDEQVSLQNVVGQMRSDYDRAIGYNARWIVHTQLRLTYERAMLGDYKEPPKPKRELPPIVNYRGEGFWTVTKEQWAKIPSDYRGCRPIKATAEHGAHRLRVCMGMFAKREGVDIGEKNGHTYQPVFITDQKEVARPAPASAEQQEAAHNAALVKAHGEAMRQAERQGERAAERAEGETKAAPFQAIKAALKSGGVQVVTANQLFPTPRAIAERMIEEAAIEPGMCVLEPSAGTGNLVRAIVDTVDTEVLAYEINQSLCSQLERTFPSYRLQVRCRDFLEVDDFMGCYPRVVMNPPFENGADIEHIQHALRFLRPGGRLVALCAAGPRQRRAMEVLGAVWEDLPAGSFSEQGTNVNVAIVVIDKAEVCHDSTDALASVP